MCLAKRSCCFESKVARGEAGWTEYVRERSRWDEKAGRAMEMLGTTNRFDWTIGERLERVGYYQSTTLLTHFHTTLIYVYIHDYIHITVGVILPKKKRVHAHPTRRVKRLFSSGIFFTPMILSTHVFLFGMNESFRLKCQISLLPLEPFEWKLQTVNVIDFSTILRNNYFYRGILPFPAIHLVRCEENVGSGAGGCTPLLFFN